MVPEVRANNLAYWYQHNARIKIVIVLKSD